MGTMLLGSVPMLPRNPRSSVETQSARQSTVPATRAKRRAPLHATPEPIGAVVAPLAQPWTGPFRTVRNARYSSPSFGPKNRAVTGSGSTN